MLDEYRALSVALRRPMGRWWRRVGLWWLSGLTVLMLAEGAIRGYIVPWLEAGSKAASAASGTPNIMRLLNVEPWGWLGITDVLLCLGRALIFCACLLAGAQAARLALELQREFPHPTPGATRRLCFLQALIAGWPFMLTWLALGSNILTLLLCAITGRHDTLLGSQSINVVDYSTPAVVGEPWAALVTIVLLIALANARAEARAPAWLWATALGWAPVLKAARDALFMLPVPFQIPNRMLYSQLPELDIGLGWVMGGVCLAALIMLYRRKQKIWAGILLAVLLVSAMLSGFGEEIPLVHHQQVTNAIDQIEVSSPAGLALGVVRSLSDFPRSALVSYEAFEKHQQIWSTWDDATQSGAAGALRFYVPKPWFILAPAWARLIVAPLNLLYLLLLVYAIVVFMMGETKPRSNAVVGNILLQNK